MKALLLLAFLAGCTARLEPAQEGPACDPGGTCCADVPGVFTSCTGGACATCQSLWPCECPDGGTCRGLVEKVGGAPPVLCRGF